MQQFWRIQEVLITVTRRGECQVHYVSVAFFLLDGILAGHIHISSFIASADVGRIVVNTQVGFLDLWDIDHHWAIEVDTGTMQ